jgi:hypothetical protein
MISLLVSTSVFATIQTQVHPSRISVGDAFQLTLVTDNNTHHSEPDLTPLQTDFFMQASAHSLSTSLINGQLSTREQWVITLQPQRMGKLTIPRIQIGSEYSTPTEITVTHATTIPPQDHSAILTNRVSNKKPYINQEIRYTVKLMHRDPLLDNDYQPPQLEDGFVIPLGQGKHYQTTFNNELVDVDEQEYALFPQKSGQQTLQAPQLHGALLQYGRPQRVHLHGQPITLHVKPIPKGSSRKNWFPARAVSLTEQYDTQQTTMTQGGTLRRTIKLTALGEPAELFPAIHAKTPDGISAYPDKPELKNRLNGQELVGEKSVVVSYLFNQAGPMTLPAYRIEWFDTADQTLKSVTLPARQLQIKAANKPATQSISPIEKTPTPVSTPATTHYTPWIIAGLFALLWLLTLSYPYWRPLARRITWPRRPRKRTTLAMELLSDDPRRAEQALLSWAHNLWPNATIQHLEDIINLIDDAEIREELSKLLAQRYGKSAQNNWQGHRLWDKLKHYRPVRAQKKSRTDLPPINP